MNKVKPFYIKTKDINVMQAAQLYKKAVGAGAKLHFGIAGYHVGVPRQSLSVYDYLGVNVQGCTRMGHGPYVFGPDAVELTLDQVDEHLGLFAQSAGRTLRSNACCIQPIAGINKSITNKRSARCIKDHTPFNFGEVYSVEIVDDV